MQDYDGSLALTARSARVHGDEIKYEAGPDRDNLGFWLNPDDWADWQVEISQPGRFEVVAEVAAPEKSSLAVSVGDSTATGSATVTGDYGKFKTAKLGTIEIPAKGDTTLSVHAVKDGWHPLNLKAIRLKPIAAAK
jgi:hypothetical protein